MGAAQYHAHPCSYDDHPERNFAFDDQIEMVQKPGIHHVPVIEDGDFENHAQQMAEVNQADLIKKRRFEDMKFFLISICLIYILQDGVLFAIEKFFFKAYLSYFNTYNQNQIPIIFLIVLIVLYLIAYISTKRQAQNVQIQIIINFCITYLTSLCWACALSIACNEYDSDERNIMIDNLLFNLSLYRIINGLVMIVIIIYIANIKGKLKYSVMSLLLIPTLVSIYYTLYFIPPIILLYIQILQLISQLRKIQLQNEVKAFQSDIDYTIKQIVSSANQIYFSILTPWKYY